MLNRLVKRLYLKLPIVRELSQIDVSLKKLNEQLGRTFGTIYTDPTSSPFLREVHPKSLLKHHGQVCSQNGEDGMIDEIFRRIGTTNRVFVELGVGDGTQNNTAFLLASGWTGYWIDGDPSFEPMLERPDLKGALKGVVSYITRANVESLLEQLAVPQSFDLLSIDVDQNTYYIWDAIQQYKPRVVVVEYNAAIPAAIDWKAVYSEHRTWDGTQNFGASLKAFEKLGQELGYSLVGCDVVGVNAFFVESKLLQNHFESPFTAEQHYQPPRYALSSRRSHVSAVPDRNIEVL